MSDNRPDLSTRPTADDDPPAARLASGDDPTPPSPRSPWGEVLDTTAPQSWS